MNFSIGIVKGMKLFISEKIWNNSSENFKLLMGKIQVGMKMRFATWILCFCNLIVYHTLKMPTQFIVRNEICCLFFQEGELV